MKKIDLHMHSLYSDGVYDVSTLLKMAEEKGLSIISITDHDNCRAHIELMDENVRNNFSGDIKIGMEITTSFYGQKIELLAYDFNNIETVNEFFINKKESVDWKKVAIKSARNVLEIFDELNIKYPDKYKENLEIPKFESKLYDDILLLNDKEELKKKLGTSYSLNGKEFFRKCVCAPYSIFSINFSKYIPSLDEVITFIHENGGILFLAHPYAYKMKNTEEFLDNLYDEYKDIDGIECYYYDFTKKQINYIKDFSEKRNLMISGGSDFHGNLGRKNQMEICINNDGYIPKELLDTWKKDKTKQLIK
jgi:predicted metal-dependent phosphoesterase TrpH